MDINKSSLLYGFINGFIVYYIYPIYVTAVIAFLNNFRYVGTIVTIGICIICTYIFARILIIKKNINKFKNFSLNMTVGYIAGIIFAIIVLLIFNLILYRHIYLYYPHIIPLENRKGDNQTIFLTFLGTEIRGRIFLIIDYTISMVAYWLCKWKSEKKDRESNKL